MGGNALKNTFTRRYSKEEYFAVMPEIFAKLKAISPHTKLIDIPAYASKESFGDMDILIIMDSAINYYPEIEKQFATNEFIINGGVCSFDYKELQIDLIQTREENFEINKVYYSYNDLGNLMGRIAQKLGFKYGHYGLFYWHKVDGSDHNKADIFVTQDPEVIFNLLGYSYEEFKKGFNTLDDIFKFISNGKYFSPEIYLLENRNSVSRIRDKKRKTYMEFLTYCEMNKNNFKQPEPTLSQEEIFKTFPELEKEVVEIEVQVKRRKAIKAKFNGDIIAEHTGLKGRELGEFFEFLSKFTNNELTVGLQNYVGKLSPEEIKEFVVDMSSRFKTFKDFNKSQEEWKIK